MNGAGSRPPAGASYQRAFARPDLTPSRCFEEIARQQFEDATRDLTDRTRFTTVQTLQEVGLDWSDIDRILLVGGSTRVPAVRKAVESFFGRLPRCRIGGIDRVQAQVRKPRLNRRLLAARRRSPGRRAR